MFFGSFVLSSCLTFMADEGGLSTNFQSLSQWDLDAQNNFELTEILLGSFQGESSIQVPDVLLTGDSQTLIFQNLIKQNSSGWNPSVAVTGLANFAISAAIHFDDPSSALDQLLFVRSDTRQLLRLRANAEAQYGLRSSLALNSFQPVEIALNQERSAVLVGGADGVHQIINLETDSGFSVNPSVILGGEAVVEILSADFNDDGVGDFIVVGETSAEVLRGAAGKTYTSVLVNLARDLTREIRAARSVDLNGDDRPDLLLATNRGFEYWQNNGAEGSTISFQTQDINVIDSVTDVLEFEVVDLTEDLIADLVVLSDSQGLLFYSGRGNRVFSNLTEIAFETAGLARPFGEGSLASEIVDFAVGDIDGDRVQDLVIVNDSGRLSVFFNLTDDGLDADL